jgi:quercetin dioxygenase-like cupin family protein
LNIHSAQIILPTSDLNASLEFLTTQLGFRLEMIMPADSPILADISGHGISIRLAKRENAASNVVLRLLCNYKFREKFPDHLFLAPGGIRIELVEHPAPITLPPVVQKFTLSTPRDVRGVAAASADGVVLATGTWSEGRAGMLYRDLIPGKLGGRFIASHIRIPNGGETADYVHYHRVRFQMIYCISGWARLIYEDQGPSFVMNAGDCILQPPEIRHRVLETSAGLEVIEIGCPAVHETFTDHDLQLPTSEHKPERLFDGQRFLHYTATGAEWDTSSVEGFEVRDTGMLQATQGLARVRVIGNTSRNKATLSCEHSGEFLFLYILGGEGKIRGTELGVHSLQAGDCCTIPAGAECEIAAGEGFQMLEVFIDGVGGPSNSSGEDKKAVEKVDELFK